MNQNNNAILYENLSDCMNSNRRKSFCSDIDQNEAIIISDANALGERNFPLNDSFNLPTDGGFDNSFNEDETFSFNDIKECAQGTLLI